MEGMKGTERAAVVRSSAARSVQAKQRSGSARAVQSAKTAKAAKRPKKGTKTTASEKGGKQKRLGFSEAWREVCKKQRPLMMAMIGLLVVSVVLLIFSLVMLRPQGSLVIIGYGDVYGEIVGLSEGYRYGNWMNMLAFPVLALMFGVIHNLLALRVYQKYGRNLALIVVYATLLLVAGTFVVLFRLLGEW